jgi:hypothetical protein
MAPAGASIDCSIQKGDAGKKQRELKRETGHRALSTRSFDVVRRPAAPPHHNTATAQTLW